MLFIPPGTSKLTRIHGAYVSDQEITRIVNFIKMQAPPAYDASIESSNWKRRKISKTKKISCKIR